MTYLIKHHKTSVWYFRKTIEPELRAVLGRVEWYESLRTKDYEEAKEKVKLVGIKVDAAIREARKAMAAVGGAATSDAWDGQGWVRDLMAGLDLPVMAGPAAYDEVTLDDAKTIALAWARNRLADHENRVAVHGVQEASYGPVPLPNPPRNWISGDIDVYRFQVGRQLNCPVSRPSIVDQVRDLRLTSANIEIAIFEAADRFGLVLDPAGDSWRRLRYAILLTMEALMAGIDRINSGQGLPVPPPVTVTSEVPTVVSKKDTSKKPETQSKRLSELYAMYSGEAETSPKMALEHSTIFNRLRNVLGGDVAVNTITKAQIVEFKTILFRLPTYMTAVQKKKNLREVAAETPEAADRLSNTSVRKSISILQTIFEWGSGTGSWMSTRPKERFQPNLGKLPGRPDFHTVTKISS